MGININDITVRREGRHWIYSDGTVLPVVSGGDGTTDAAFVGGVVEGNPDAVVDGFVNVPGGLLTGVDPATAPAPTSVVTQPPGVPATTETNPDTGRTFTAAEVEAARKQERDKLYADIEKTKERNKELEKAEKERLKAEEARQQQIDEEARLAAEAEMDAKQLVESRTSAFEQQLAEERQRREALEATLEQERRYVELERYKAQVISASAEDILPQLVDMVRGNTPEEIDQSIESLKARTASILGDVSQTVAQVRQGMQGASVTAPPVGPMDTQQNYQSISPQDIAAMTPQQYAQHRESLLGAVRQQVNDRGIYGP